MNLADMTGQVAAGVDFGQPGALKRGRNPKWPYVPVILRPDRQRQRVRQEQVRGVAFATRAEALDYAERTIKARRDLLRRQLLEPRYRALRERYGLPREVSAA